MHEYLFYGISFINKLNAGKQSVNKIFLMTMNTESRLTVNQLVQPQ